MRKGFSNLSFPAYTTYGGIHKKIEATILFNSHMYVGCRGRIIESQTGCSCFAPIFSCFVSTLYHAVLLRTVRINLSIHSEHGVV